MNQHRVWATRATGRVRGAAATRRACSVLHTDRPKRCELVPENTTPGLQWPTRRLRRCVPVRKTFERPDDRTPVQRQYRRYLIEALGGAWPPTSCKVNNVAPPDCSLNQDGTIHSSLVIVGLINHSQYLRVRLSRIGIDRDHLAARIALEYRDDHFGPDA